MKIIFYRADQYESFHQAIDEGGAKMLHIEDYEYKGHHSGAVADAYAAIQTATDMMEHKATICYAVLTDDDKLIDAF